MENAFQIERPEAAAVFSDSRRRRLILEFAKGPRAMKDISEATGMQLTLLNYHVRRLQELGLLRFVRAEARAGRPVRFYEAVAKAFFVPEHLAPSRPSHELTMELRAALDRTGSGDDQTGVLYYLDGERGPRMRRLGGQSTRAAEYWRLLNLTDTEARQLNKDMQALLNRYENSTGSGARPYLTLCAIAPRLLKGEA